MEQNKQEHYAEMAVQLFDFIVYNSVDFFEQEMKQVQEQIGQPNDENMEFELLVLKSFLMDYIVSGEYGFQSIEKDVIVEIYYHHFEEFLAAADKKTLPFVQKRLKEYAETITKPTENHILIELAIRYASTVLREPSQENYEKVSAFAIYVLNDLIQRVNNIIQYQNKK